jgi:hypothetical protein
MQTDYNTLLHEFAPSYDFILFAETYQNTTGSECSWETCIILDKRSPEIPALVGTKHVGIRIYVAEDMINRKTCEVSNVSACRSLDVAGEGPKT